MNRLIAIVLAVLMAEGQLYSLTAIGIENAGWTVVETLENPA